MTKRDYYEVLGVSRTATDQEIKSAYRRLAVKYHPDKNPNDASAEDKFKEAAEAYSVLADAEQRQRYNRFGHAGVSSAAGQNWGAPGFGGIEDILGDLFGFGDVFGGGRTGGRRSAAQRGADLRYDLEISLEEANDGYTWPLFAQFTEVQPILWGEIEKVLSRQKEPQEALDFAAEEATKIFERDGLI